MQTERAHPDDLHAFVENATAGPRERLQQRLALHEGALLRERYVRVLEALLGFYAPMEQRLCFLEGWSDLGMEPLARRRRPLIEADLVALGRSLEEVRALPRSLELPAPATAREGLGCLFALERMHLDHVVVAPPIEAALGVGAGFGASFFAADGDDAARRFRRFLGRLVEIDDRGPLRARVVDLALETHRALERWLEQRGALVR